MLHLAGDAGGDVELRGDGDTGNADVELGGQPVDALGQRTGAGDGAAQLGSQVASLLQILLSGEATAGGHDDIGLGRVGSGLLTLDVAGDLGGALGGNPGDILGSAGTGGLGSIELICILATDEISLNCSDNFCA